MIFKILYINLQCKDIMVWYMINVLFFILIIFQLFLYMVLDN